MQLAVFFTFLVFCFRIVFGSEMTVQIVPGEIAISVQRAESIYEGEASVAQVAPCSNCGRFGCRTCCLSTVSIAGVVPRPEPVEALFITDLDNSLLRRRLHPTLPLPAVEPVPEPHYRRTRPAHSQNFDCVECCCPSLDALLDGREVCPGCFQYCPEQCAGPRAACNDCMSCCLLVTCCLVATSPAARLFV